MNNSKSLYKYINLDKSPDDVKKIIDGIFIDSQFKITTPRYFNDRFDSRIILDKENIKEIINKFDVLFPNNHTLNEDQIKLHALYYEAQPILCLSEISPVDFDSDIMWGIYGGNGKGICLEFDYDKIQKINGNLLSYRENFKVDYNDSNSKYELLVDSFKHKMLSELEPDENKHKQLLFKSIFDIPYTKGLQWSHEAEYRLIEAKYIEETNIKLNKTNSNIKDRILEFNKLASRNDYFISIVKEKIDSVETHSYGYVRNYTELHLPIPEAIYIGFTHYGNSKENLEKIKSFAKKYSIHEKVYTLSGAVNYNIKKFKTTPHKS